MSESAPAPDRQIELASLRRMETALSRILKTGIVASVVLMLVGTAISYLHHPGFFRLTSDPVSAKSWSAAYTPCSLEEVASGVAAGRGRAVIILGLLMLIATPVARVAVAFVVLARRRERVYAVLAAMVLALLAMSFQLGRRARSPSSPEKVEAVDATKR